MFRLKLGRWLKLYLLRDPLTIGDFIEKYKYETIEKREIH